MQHPKTTHLVTHIPDPIIPPLHPSNGLDGLFDLFHAQPARRALRLGIGFVCGSGLKVENV